MVEELIYDDGFTVIEQGDFRVRVNKAHVVLSCDAIRKRWCREIQHEISSDNVVRLTQVA